MLNVTSQTNDLDTVYIDTMIIVIVRYIYNYLYVVLRNWVFINPQYDHRADNYYIH